MVDDASDQQEAKERYLSYRSFRLMKELGIKRSEARQRAIEELRGDFDRDWLEFVKTMQPKLEVKNHNWFSSKGVDLASIWITPVMLKKSIVDATDPIRYLLKSNGLHDYANQLQGIDNRVFLPVIFLDSTISTRKMSLYRPETKNGDPRLWPGLMAKFCKAGDEVGLAVIHETCVLFNLSLCDYEKVLSGQVEGKTELEQKVLTFLRAEGEERFSEVAKELLQKLRELVGQALEGPKPKEESSSKRDTDVGMAVEKALGVPPNSRARPDYRGIELKSWRDKGGKSKENRHALFTQVPDWTRSNVKSIRDFVQKVGYPVSKQAKLNEIPEAKRATARELRCTVCSTKLNSQRLALRVEADDLIEFQQISEKVRDDLLLWPGELLRDRLATKHPETFWIACKSQKREDGREVFFVEKIRYTRRPMVAQFLSLIEQGVVTLDHMIGYRKGKLSEKGPSFKIYETDLSRIFPENIEIDLREPLSTKR